MKRNTAKKQSNTSKIATYSRLVSDCITDNHFVSCYDCPAELTCILKVTIKNLSK